MMLIVLIAGFLLVSTVCIVVIPNYLNKKEKKQNSNAKMLLQNGGYECLRCGSRKVTELDKSCSTCGIQFENAI